MKIIDYLVSKFRSIFKWRRNLSKIDSKHNEALTLRRAKLNRISEPFSKNRYCNEEPCHTKQFRHRQIAKNFRWVITVVEGNDRGRQFIGATPELKIGRQPENHICLRDPKVSRFHALIKVKDSHLIIKDLQSTNGTYINNVRIARRKLHTGDLVKMGDTLIQVTLEKN